MLYNDTKDLKRGFIMLFRKKIASACAYCRNSVKIDDEQVLCMKRGVRPAASKCRKFSYDPCKRVPPKVKAINFSKYQEEDLSL